MSLFTAFENKAEAFPKFELDQPPSSLFAFCRFYTRGFEKPLIIMSILAALMAVLEVSLFGFMGQLVDWLNTQDKSTFFRDQKGWLIGSGILLIIALPLISLIHSLIVHQTLISNYASAIRWSFHRYLLSQSVSFYQNDFAGRIATKVMQTTVGLREAVMKLMDVLTFISVYFVSIAFLVAQSDMILIIPLLIWLLVYISLNIYFIPKLRAASEATADARSTMTGRIVDSYTNITTVKLFSHTQRESDYAKEGMKCFLEKARAQMRLITVISSSIKLTNYLLTFTTSAMSIWLWSIDKTSLGAIAIAVSLTLRLNGMAQWIMWEISTLFENIGTVLDGIATISKPIQILDAPNATQLTVKKGKIEFKNVRFNFGKSNGLFESLNLEIKPGEKVGLVGRSGSGKSTILQLLLRFHDPSNGEITIDDQPIHLVKQESLRENIGMVTQDTSLLHRSVRENLLYGNSHATEQDMIRASKHAHAHDFIVELSDRNGNKSYDALVGERGVKLSGGQRQRIALARVLLKNAPILVLDEATSALDSEVEAAIQENLTMLMEGKTVIAVAHRLSTIAAMDRLIILDNGKIIEEGNHQTLIALNGVYKQLWAHQTGGFLGCE